MAKSKHALSRAKPGAKAALPKPRAIPSVRPVPLADMLAAAGLAAPRQPLPATAILNQEVALEQVLSALSRLPDPDLVIDQLGMSRADLRKLETDDEISAALETRREAVIATQTIDPSRWRTRRWATTLDVWSRARSRSERARAIRSSGWTRSAIGTFISSSPS